MTKNPLGLTGSPAAEKLFASPEAVSKSSQLLVAAIASLGAETDAVSLGIRRPTCSGGPKGSSRIARDTSQIRHKGGLRPAAFRTKTSTGVSKAEGRRGRGEATSRQTQAPSIFAGGRQASSRALAFSTISRCSQTRPCTKGRSRLTILCLASTGATSKLAFRRGAVCAAQARPGKRRSATAIPNLCGRGQASGTI